MNIIYWLTHNVDTGEPYHTLRHCMSNDKLWIILMSIILITTIFQYTDIAYSAYIKSKPYKNSAVKKSFLSLMYVFVFCAISGYGFKILQLFIPAYKLLFFLLLLLNWYTHKLRVSIKYSDFLAKIYSVDAIEKQSEDLLKIISESLRESVISQSEREILIRSIELKLKRDITKYML